VTKEGVEHSHIRLVISFGIGCIGCLAAALTGLPATAGTNSWTAIGPDGTNVSALAIDPHTPSTAFAGTQGSGILKSTDSGANWAPANFGLPTPYIFALAIDPLTPSTLYAGTDVGVFKSTDGGYGWSAAPGLVGGEAYINALAIDPTSPSTLYAATVNGVFKTIDGAASWISVNAGLSGLMPRVIAIDPTMPSTLYVGVDDGIDCSRCGVFKSADAGTSWTRIYATPFDATSFTAEGQEVMAIAIDSSSPSRLYVALSTSSRERVGGIARSTDGGASWSDTAWPSRYPCLSSSNAGLAVASASPTTVYAGTCSGEIFRTTDAGVHWLPVTDGPLASSSITVMATASSTPAMIYAGGSTGLYRSSDDAETWTRLTTGVRSIALSRFAVDPLSPSTIYSTVGGVVMKTTDGGGHWAEAANGLSLSTVNSLVIDPAFPSTIYVGRGDDYDSLGGSPFGDGPVYKSIDRGAHWADASQGLPTALPSGIRSLAIAPSLGSTLYAGDIARGVSKSVDGGLSWREVNNGLNRVGPYIFVSALAIDPTNADILYVATSPNGGPDTAKIFKSTDGAGQWRQVPISGPAGSIVTSVVVDPATPSTVYAAYGYGNVGDGGLFKSMDSGETWTAAQNGLSSLTVYALAIDPNTPSRIYAGTSNGVFMSTDAAATWTPINDGMTGPDLNVLAISIDRTGSILRAASNVGLFEYQIVRSPSPGTVALIEYFHALVGDYFITASPDEISQLDNGAFPGWARTGLQFHAYAAFEWPSVPVCRFFSSGFSPKDTHFFTPFAAECAALRGDANWTLESPSAFAIALPSADGICAAGLIPVYRFYDASRGGVPNHRYTTDLAVRAQMISQGWVAEGLGPNAVEMCSPP
jgi:photosystem II stability/assembly factor-like uncharacterized protein